MASLLRVLLVATALLSSGVLQVAAAMGDDGCCSGETSENDAPCPDCPPGLACACCPLRGVAQAAEFEIAPATSPGIAISVVVAEPSLGTTAGDIFQPPRA